MSYFDKCSVMHCTYNYRLLNRQVLSESGHWSSTVRMPLSIHKAIRYCQKVVTGQAPSRCPGDITLPPGPDRMTSAAVRMLTSITYKVYKWIVRKVHWPQHMHITNRQTSRPKDRWKSSLSSRALAIQCNKHQVLPCYAQILRSLFH